MKPFLKWAGGKSQLLDVIREELPADINSCTRYVEPFVGAGAVFLDFLERDMFEEYIINDINHRLISLYQTIKERPLELINNLSMLVNDYLGFEAGSNEREEIYYDIRKKFNDEKNSQLDIAVYFIFLNKTCFNGLYRENSKGEFNVPIGSYKNPSFFDREQIFAISTLLNKTKPNGENRVVILNQSFDTLEEYVDENTFVYMDPPYRPVTKGGFTTYNKGNFNDDSQIKLCEFYKTLDKHNAKLLLSNSDPKNLDENDLFFDDLYSEFAIKRVFAKRSINSNGSLRGDITELLIKNY